MSFQPREGERIQRFNLNKKKRMIMLVLVRLLEEGKKASRTVHLPADEAWPLILQEV